MRKTFGKGKYIFLVRRKTEKENEKKYFERENILFAEEKENGE